MIEIPVYLQVAKRRWGYWPRGVVRRATYRRPEHRLPDTILIKITLLVPDAAFEPIEPQAVVEVPASLIEPIVTVTAEGADR